MTTSAIPFPISAVLELALAACTGQADRQTQDECYKAAAKDDRSGE